MQHSNLSFKVTNTLVEIVSSCRKAKSHRQTLGNYEDGPALWLVKDHGIYLMSNEVFPESEMHQPRPVVYAEECNPTTMSFDDWWAAGLELLGGDDCVTPLKLDLFELLISKGRKYIHFHVTLETGELHLLA